MQNDKVKLIKDLMDLRDSIDSPSLDWDIYKALQAKIVQLIEDL